MLTYNELKRGTIFALNDEPYEVLEYEFLRMQQRKPVAKTKIKNLINGKVLERNFHQNETFEEAEIEKETVKYIYSHKDEYWFTEKDNPSKRFSLPEETLGSTTQFLKPNTEVMAIKFNNQIINIKIPIKVDLKVKETQPGIKGGTAQGGTKPAILESDAKITVPMFVNTGDIVRINTETGTYVERVEKNKE